MSWPPPTLPTNRTNALAQQDNHPADHNAANLAINDLVARLTTVDAMTVRTWTPNLSVGGWPVIGANGGVITYAKYVIVGKIRVGAARIDFPAANPGSPANGGFVINTSGIFWSPGSAGGIQNGGFRFFQSGAVNHTGYTMQYGTAGGLAFQVHGQNNILGVTPSLGFHTSDALEFWVASIEP